jgi:DNA-binding NarL/FixJ family response regulator
MNIRVLLADDHPVVRAGLRAILAGAPDMLVVGECTRGDQVVPMALESRPDVVLMDLRMPGMDGVAATAAVTARVGCRVLILTTFDTDGDILRAISAGATSYLLKGMPESELIGAVRAAAGGETLLAPAVATRLVDAVRRPEPTVREVEVLRLVASGLSNAEISEKLVISPATVKSHLLNLFAKLDVSDRTAAVTVAMARGWLPPP